MGQVIKGGYLFTFGILVAAFVPRAGYAEEMVQLSWPLSPSDKVGGLKSGLACFPDGSLRWQEIAKPEPQVLNTLLEASVVSSQENMRATGSVIDLKAMVCAAWLGVGAKPKSKIKITIRWRIKSDDLPIFEKTVETKLARKEFDIRFDSALLIEAVQKNLQQALLKE